MVALGLIYFVCTLFIGVAAFVWRKFFSSSSDTSDGGSSSSSGSGGSGGGGEETIVGSGDNEVDLVSSLKKVSSRESGRRENVDILDETLKSVMEENGVFIDNSMKDDDAVDEDLTKVEPSNEVLEEIETNPQKVTIQEEPSTKLSNQVENLSETCPEHFLSLSQQYPTETIPEKEADNETETIRNASDETITNNNIEQFISNEEKEVNKELPISEIYNLNYLLIMQAIIRGLLQRNSFGQVKGALSLITQGLLNSFNIRNELNEEKNNLATLQSFLRNINSVRKFIDEKQKVQLIQAFIQSRLEFMKTSEKKEQIIALQSILKSKVLMKNLKNLMNSLSTLQCFVHSKIVEEKFLSTVTTIQSLQARVRSKYQSKQVGESLKGLEVLQSRFISSLVEKDLRRQLESISILQANAHGFITVKKLQNHVENCKMIQSACIAYLKQQEILNLANMSSMIHALISSKKERINCRNHIDSMKQLESAMRGYSQRKTMFNSLKFIILLQSITIGKSTRKSLQENIDRFNTFVALSKSKCSIDALLVEKSRLLLFQSLARSRLVTRQLNVKQNNEMDLALTIQSLHTSSKVRRAHTDKERSVKLIQSLLSASRKRKVLSEEKKKLETIQATIHGAKTQHFHKKNLNNLLFIQSLMISKMVRNDTNESKSNLVLLQSLARERNAQKQFSHNLEHALVLTAFTKGRLMRHLFETQSIQVSKIQSFTRQFTARKQMMKEISNVFLLESLCNGFVERKNLSNLLSSVLNCQCLIRGFLTRKTRHSDEQIDNLDRKTQLAFLIQTCILARNTRLTREQAIGYIRLFQAVSRSFLIFDSLQQEEILSLNIQSLCRRMSERKVFSTELNDILVMQAICRRALENHVSTDTKSRTLIMQANIRRCLENNCTREELSRVEDFQSLSCGFVNKQFVKNQIFKVIIMQSIIRAIANRNEFKISNTHLNLLQARLRGYSERSIIEGKDVLSEKFGSLVKGFIIRRELFEKTRKLIIPTMQASSRQYSTRRDMSRSLKLVTYIQSMSRRQLSSVQLTQSLSRIVSLQALVRGHSRTQNSSQNLEIIPYTQALFRGKQVRNTNIYSKDVSVIQSVARSLKHRHILEQAQKSVGMLQTVIMGYTARKDLSENIMHITSSQDMLKAIVLSNNLRKHTKQSLSLISHMQQQIKTRIEKENCQKKKKCTLLLQALSRGYHIRKYIRNIAKPSIEVVNSVCIGHIERKTYREQIQKVKLIQSLARRKQECNQISNQRQNLLLLQAVIKSWQTQNNFKKELEEKLIYEIGEKIKRAVVIQGFIRGFLFRRDDLLYTKKRQGSPTHQTSEVPSTAEILRQLYQNDEFGDNEDSEEEEVQLLHYPEESIPEPVLIDEPHVVESVMQSLVSSNTLEETPSIIPIPLHRKSSNAPLPSINVTASTPTPTTTPSSFPPSKETVSTTSNSRLPSQKPPTRRQIIQNIIEDCKRTKNPILDLSGYDLETLPYSAIDCKHVTELRLSQNNLVTLPSWFVDTFINLKDLDLSGNQLYELPIELSRLSLTSINLSNNKFEFLPQALNEMNTLTKIDISENVLLSLPSTISHLFNVEELDISNNYLMTLPDDIKKLKKLKQFHYYNNEYLQSEISKIAEVISVISGEKSKTIIQKLRNEDNMGYKEISSKYKDNLFLDPFDMTDMSEATEMYNEDDGGSEYSMTEDAMLSPRLLRNNSSITETDTTTSTPITPISGRNNYNLDTPLSGNLSVTTEEYGTLCITPPNISDSDSEDAITPPKYNPPVMIPQIKLEVMDNLESPCSSPAEQSPISNAHPKVTISEEDKKVNFGQLNKDGNERSLTEVVHMEHPFFATPKIRPVSSSYKRVAVDESEEEQKEREAKENKKSKERINMVLEILESERKYVKYLEVLWDLFYEPIVNNYFPADKNKNPEESERLVPKAVAKGFFPNDLLTIRTFNKNFLSKLEDRFKIYKGDPTKIYDMLIGDLFEKIAPFFKIYTSYLSSYESTMNKIREYRTEDKKFDKWLDKRKTHPRCAGLEIGSFLIMPVQRIPRYKLLLENLCKNTPSDHADYSNLVSAIEKITESATTQNSKIKETNNRIKVYQLSRLMKLSDLVQPHRRLIREGEIVFGDQPKIEFKAYLFNDIFVFREKKRQKTKVGKSVKAYSLLDAYISGGGQNRLSMILLNAEKNKTVEKEILFPSHEIKMEWVLEIEKALEEVREKRELISKGTKAIVRTSSRAGRFFRALKSPGRKGDLSPTSSNLSANSINQPSTPSTSAPELRGITRTNSTVSDQSTTSIVSNLSVISSTSNALSSSTSTLGSEGKKKSILGKIMGLGKKK